MMSKNDAALELERLELAVKTWEGDMKLHKRRLNKSQQRFIEAKIDLWRFKDAAARDKKREGAK